MNYRDMIYKKVFVIFAAFFFTAVFAAGARPQSKDLNLPTPIVGDVLSGVIKARDVGDSRLTSYYYAFECDRGDVFINVVTNNFNGDIDVFLKEGLAPKTKITIYADRGQNETGRIIYLRKPEKMILRIQGRTPNDDPATFRIKFAGSFKPLKAVAGSGEELPTVEDPEEGVVKVNSVGTIIEEPEEDTEKIAEVGTKKPAEDKAIGKFDPTKKPETILKEAIEYRRPRVIIDDPFGVKSENSSSPSVEEKELTVQLKDKKDEPSTLVSIERLSDEEEEVSGTENEFQKPTDQQLRNIKLILILKNGEKIERRLNSVSSVNFFDGILKVVGIDGKVERFSILDIEKMSIEN